jgi:protein SCO1/2
VESLSVSRYAAGMFARSHLCRFLGPLLFLCFTAGCDRSESGEAGGPIAGKSDSDTGPLPSLHQVPPFTLTNQTGRPWGSQELAGKPYLAAFMFTRCPSICPELTARMREVDLAMKRANKELRLVSISVDPETDTPDVLSAYAKKHKAAVDNWYFLTGDSKVIAQTSEEGFKVALAGKVEEGKPHLGITHGSHLVLVDAQGTIRGYFRSSEDETVAKLVAAMDRL